MSYTNPESALKHIRELREGGNMEATLEELHYALHGRKFRGNNPVLEGVMVILTYLLLYTTYSLK